MKIPTAVRSLAMIAGTLHAEWPPSPIVDTGQELCYNTLEPITPPRKSREFYGQDAQYQGVPANYNDNGDGTVTDKVTGLTWSKGVDAEKLTFDDALLAAENLTLGGHDDWRLPNIKELYSLIDFRGVTGLMGRGMDRVPPNAIPYINTDYFDFLYGDVDHGERFIDAQWLTTTVSVSPIMQNRKGLFGVNFADGRIKCYPFEPMHRGQKTFYVRYVRGRVDYAVNQFIENGDGTVTDRATSLTWTQSDSGRGMHWEDALAYAEALELGGHTDWRLPNAKELQSIVDYSRSPDATGTPAIDPIFDTSPIQNEAGQRDFPFFWTSTTHLDGPNAGQAVYLSFGRAIGQMHDQTMDVHGAGCQRSDPKVGEAGLGHGPQGDARRVLNYVRCVRSGAIEGTSTTKSKQSEYPNRIHLADGTHYNPEPMRFQERPNRPPNEDRSSQGTRPPPPQRHRPPPHF